MRRRLWLWAAVVTSVVGLYAQEPAAPAEPPAPEAAGSSSETPAEAVEETPENVTGGEATGAPAESPAPPEPPREPEAEGTAISRSSTDQASITKTDAPTTRSTQSDFDPTNNAEWESRHASDRVPAATKPPGIRPRHRGVGWFQQSRERVRRQRSALWERVAEVRGRGPALRSP